MKNMFVWLIAVVLISLSANCQKLNVPDKVKSAFEAKFPKATNVKWGKESANEYEAEFKSDNISIATNFASDGRWIVTETTIPVTELPQAVKNTISAKYPGATINIIEKVEKPTKTYYEIQIKTNGKKMGLEVNNDGSFVK